MELSKLKNSGIYITADGIVGYYLKVVEDLFNPRDFDDNKINIYSFKDDNGDRDLFSYVETVTKEKMYDRIKDRDIIKGLKIDEDILKLEICDIEEANYGYICSQEKSSLNEEQILGYFQSELKDYNCYLKGMEYCCVKYDFKCEEEISYEYLYGDNPEDAGIFMMMGEPLNEESIRDYNLDSIDVEYMIPEGIFLENFALFEFFKDNLKNEEIVKGINEFSIDGESELFGRESFIDELFIYLKKLEVPKRKKSEGLKLIISYLMEKVDEIWANSYGLYGWT